MHRQTNIKTQGIVIRLFRPSTFLGSHEGYTSTNKIELQASLLDALGLCQGSDDCFVTIWIGEGGGYLIPFSFRFSKHFVIQTTEIKTCC